MSLASAVARVLAILHGTTTLIFLTYQALRKQRTQKGRSQVDDKLTKEVYRKAWDLGAQPERHRFLQTSVGLQIHSIINDCDKRTSKLVILLHGFPDSVYVFDKLLNSTNLAAHNVKLVALSLPGYGGSDSPKDFGPDIVLNALTEVIAELRQQYAEKGGQTILLGHDWGGAIAFRIAAETHGLVDRVVVLNSLHVPHAKARIQLHTSRAIQELRTWQSPFQGIQPVQNAWRQLHPVVNQLMKSSYIFMFNLPFPLVSLTLAVNFIVQYCQRLHASNSSTPDATAATLNGPNETEAVSRSQQGDMYGPSVFARAKRNPPGDWLHRIRIYREGLATRPWKLHESISKYKVVRRPQKSAKKGMLQYPTTVIFGLDDLAFNLGIALDGIGEYFPNSASVNGQQSHVIRVPGQSHWFFTQEDGAKIIEDALIGLLESSQGSLDEALARDANQNVVEMTTFD